MSFTVGWFCLCVLLYPHTFSLLLACVLLLVHGCKHHFCINVMDEVSGFVRPLIHWMNQKQPRYFIRKQFVNTLCIDIMIWSYILSMLPTPAYIHSINIRTTHLSQMMDILSSVPLTPSGIKLKSSLPTARWAVLKGQCALPVTCRSPLHRRSRSGEKTGSTWS